jgi:hypothetical protein
LAVVAVAPRGRTVFVSVGSRNSGGVVRIDPDDAVHVYESDDAPKVALYHLTVSDDSLYGVNKELYALSLASSAWRREVSPMASPSFGMMSIFKSPSGLWGSTHGREIFRLGATRSQNEKYKASWFPGLGLKAGYAAEFGFEQDGQLWFGGPPWWRFKSSGFYRLDLATGEFVIYGARDGFRPAIPYECYDGLVAGDRFWLATSSGLAEVTVRKELGPKTRSDSD